MSVMTTDQLPILPEIQIIEPIAQCGVLYLGSAPPSPGRRGLDSVQEPFSHRYPVDGTNTARGIDSILSIYDNGIQLTFARQPHVVIFFPLSSLIYCASLRFSIVENDQTSLIDWRFITVDSTEQTLSKHPPLFCAVIQRTQILSGDECHCFITKSDDAALALVRTISEVYANIQSNIKPLRSPIFYQLDRYGRKITETTGVIYLSPATNDESQIDNQKNPINRQVLLDPSLDGFFYRTDNTIIEQWQLWDDDDLTGTRPRPPASPFGQNQGLYHDDLTDEIHQYLRHMDDEEPSSSCSCSTSSTEYRYHRRRSKSKTKHHSDRFNTSFSHSHTSSFDPSSSLIQNNVEIKKGPIVIEKIVPNPMITTRPKYILEQPQQSFNPSIPRQQINDDYSPFSDTYQINERGEKITQEGNRIVFMDVIQPNTINNNYTELQPSKPPRSHRKRSKHIPVIDLRSVESFLKSSKSKQHRRIIDNHEIQYENDHLSTSDMLEIVEGYFEDYKGRKLKLNGDDAQTLLGHFESSSKTKHRRTSSSNDKKHHHRRSHSTVTAGPGVNYVERPSIRPPSQPKSIKSQQQQPIPLVLNNEQVNQYVSNIYGTTKNPSQSSSSISHHEPEPSNDMNKLTAVTNLDYISPFRYMQSSINPLLLREYRNVLNGIQ